MGWHCLISGRLVFSLRSCSNTTTHQELVFCCNLGIHAIATLWSTLLTVSSSTPKRNQGGGHCALHAHTTRTLCISLSGNSRKQIKPTRMAGTSAARNTGRKCEPGKPNQEQPCNKELHHRLEYRSTHHHRACKSMVKCHSQTQKAF